MWITGPAGYVAPDKAIRPADVTRSDTRRSPVAVPVTDGRWGRGNDTASAVLTTSVLAARKKGPAPSRRLHTPEIWPRSLLSYN